MSVLQPSPRATVVGPNLPVNASASDLGDLSSHNSPSVARNPVDGGNLVIANRIDSPLFSCALHVSADGGATFRQTPIPVPEGEEPKCYAPDVAFGPDGTLFVSFVTLRGIGNVPHAVWTVRSDDGGRTLSDPLRALGPLSFQVRLTADPRVRDRLYLTWLDAEDVAIFAFPGVRYPIRVLRSDDGGATWGEPVRVSDERRLRVVAPSPAVGSGGELFVAYLDVGDDRLDYNGGHGGMGGAPYPGRWQLMLARSRDGGGTWSETVVDGAVVPTERFVVFLPPFPSVAVHRATGTVHVAFHDGRSGDADVRLWTSEDGGRTFGEPVRVNDTVEGDDTSQYLPKVTVAPDERVDIVYYDRRLDSNDVMNEVSLQSSFDGGSTFSDRVTLSDRRFDSRVGFGSERGMPDLGSRLGLLSTGDRAMAVWTDTRRGTEASGKQDLMRAFVAFTGTRPLAPWVLLALRFGGLGVAFLGLILLVTWSGDAGGRTPRAGRPEARDPRRA